MNPERCDLCRVRWRGTLPILGLLAIVATAAVVAYTVGRHLAHPRAPIPIQVQVIHLPAYQPAEPGRAGRQR